MKVPPRVWIKWVDSAWRGPSNWLEVATFDPENMDETYCESLGWLVGESLHSYFIAGHLGMEEYGSVWQIPKGCVKDIKFLDA